MKQTTNAIKFLMAQYRAIFKNAYLKGLVSAVALTAGLSVLVAPSANAATVDTSSNILGVVLEEPAPEPESAWGAKKKM